MSGHTCEYGSNGYAPRCTNAAIGYEQHGPLPEHCQFYCADHMEGDFVPFVPAPVEEAAGPRARRRHHDGDGYWWEYGQDDDGSPLLFWLADDAETAIRADVEARVSELEALKASVDEHTTVIAAKVENIAANSEALTWLMERHKARADAAEAQRDALAEALRRYMTYCETLGEEDLRKEFGPPEHEGSSWAMEEWLDRVLRIPARDALAALDAEASQ